MKKLIGYVILIGLFACLFLFLVSKHGIRVTAGVFGFTAAILTLVALGLWLIDEQD